MSTQFLTLNDDEKRDLPQAEAYVATRFFPPLPHEYGALAIIAVREYREHGPEAHVNLPADLNPLPRQTSVDDDGDLFVEAAHLIEILRLDHLILEDDDEFDDEDPEPVNECRECGEDTGNDDPHTDWGFCSSCLHDALRSGWTPGE